MLRTMPAVPLIFPPSIKAFNYNMPLKKKKSATELKSDYNLSKWEAQKDDFEILFGIWPLLGPHTAYIIQ